MYQQLKSVSLINSIVSVLTLQNTLIIVSGEFDSDMITLSTITTVGLILLCLFLIIFSFVKNIGFVKKCKKCDNNVSEEKYRI